MSATLQRRKRFERGMTVLVIAALLASLLPIPVFATSTISQPERQTDQLPEVPSAPVPPPAPQWPEAGAVAPYTPETASLPAPGVLAPASSGPVTSAAETAVAAVPAPPELVLPQGPVEFALGATAGAAGTTVLPLTLQAAGSTLGTVLTAQVQMLDKTLAEGLSPLGFAFALQLQDDSPAAASAAASQLPPASQALTLTIDYSRLPRAQVGDVGGCLALYRATIRSAQRATTSSRPAPGAGTSIGSRTPTAMSPATSTTWRSIITPTPTATPPRLSRPPTCAPAT